MKKRLKSSKEPIKEVIANHIINNIKEYATVIIIFFIGLILGIIFINNVTDDQESEICTYINGFVEVMKLDSKVDSFKLLKDSVSSNIVLTLCLWFAGCTVIGMPIVYGIIAFRGFCIGYTISAIIATLGTTKGLVFTISTILLQNILLIPTIFSLAVSGIKLYKSIMKDKRKENIKVEILRHTAFSTTACIAMIFSSFVETYVSSNIFASIVEFF